MSDPGPNIKFMFDSQSTTPAAPVLDGMVPPETVSLAAVSLERLEAEICELAGHLAAATCRFLVLLGDFDARRGWADWEMTSCAAWLSWKCQMSSGTAREHVRVARALRDLPVIRGEFGAGRLSYAKVRALTRIATPATEAGLAELAGPMTGNQLERFARAHRQVSSVDDADARVRRRLAWRFEEDGSLAGTFRLPPLQGAVLLKALRAAASDLEHPHSSDAEQGHPAQRTGRSRGSAATAHPLAPTSSSLADALLVIAEAFLVEKVAAADDAEVYQVIVHVGTDAISPASPASDAAGTFPRKLRPRPACRHRSHPGQPGALPRRGRPGHQRYHRADDRVLRRRGAGCGTTARQAAGPGKTAAPAERGAAPRGPRARQAPVPVPRVRNPPGRLHHIQYWSNGGHTKLDNLVSLC